MQRRLLLGGLAAAPAFIRAQGASAPRKIVFATNWKAQAAHGGFYQAVADGTYKRYGLDVTIQQQIIALLARLRDEHGLAQILITHNMGVVAELCDRVAVMYAGSIVEEGPVVDVVDAPRHPYTRALLAARGIRHRTIPPRTPKRNGKIERYQQTLAREWAYGQRYRSSDTRAIALPFWTAHYNTTRPHSEIGDRPPISRAPNLPGQDN